jgi:hypothetical protein
MPKRILPLSDATISKAKPKEKEHRLYDGMACILFFAGQDV